MKSAHSATQKSRASKIFDAFLNLNESMNCLLNENWPSIIDQYIQEIYGIVEMAIDLQANIVNVLIK